MLKTVQSRVLAALAALGLTAGTVVVLNEHGGCTVTPPPAVVEPVAPVAPDAGEGEGEGESAGEPETSTLTPAVVPTP